MTNLAPIHAVIPKGSLDSTSTATVMTATVPGIDALFNGVCVWLTNGVVTSASNFTININGLGGKPVYQSQAAATRSSTIFNINYTALLIYNEDRVSGGCWDYVYGYDSNTNTIGYQIRTQAVALPMDSIMYRYRLMFQSKDGKKLIPANNSTSTNATSSRTPCQTPFDPFGLIFYYGTTASVSAGSKPNSSYLWQQYNGISLGYSFNNTGAALTLTTSAPIYLKCAPQSDGTAIIDSSTPIVQTLPSTEDGKIYIFLGIAESATAIMLTLEHPVYWYKDGTVRQWTNSEVDKVDQTSATASSYSYWRPLLVGSSADANPGFTPTTVTGKTFTFQTLQVQPSTGTYRGNNVDLVSGNYKATLSATTLTANRALTLPDKGGMLARTSDIPSASDATPQALGTAAAGSSSDYSRADHVHALPTYSKSDVGLGNVDNVQQYSASNPPPYPVTSVNGSTGDVTISVLPTPTASDNGKFITVVDGAYALANLPVYNGGVS